MVFSGAQMARFAGKISLFNNCLLKSEKTGIDTQCIRKRVRVHIYINSGSRNRDVIF